MTKKSPVVFIYTRASSNEQTESCASQEKSLLALADKHGLKIKRVFKDDGISGSRTDREDYVAMKKLHCDVLLIWKQNRLGRDGPEVETEMRALEYRKTRVITHDGYDSEGGSHKNRKMLVKVNALQDELYLDNLAEDTHRGQLEHFRAGYWVNSHVYGYDRVEIPHPYKKDTYGRPKRAGVKLVFNESEKAVILDICKMYAYEGISPEAIANELTRRKVPRPSAREKKRTHRASKHLWRESTVRCILENPLYRGHYHWNQHTWIKDPTKNNKKVRHSRPESEWEHLFHEEWVIIDTVLDAAIDARKKKRASTRIAEAVRRGRAASKNTIGGNDRRHALGGILQCSGCGCFYNADGTADYICPSFVNDLCDNDQRLKAERIRIALQGMLRVHLLSPQMRERVKAEIEAELDARQGAEDAQAKESDDTELKALYAEKAKVKAAGLSSDFETECLERIDAKIAARLRERQDEAKGKRVSVQQLRDRLDEIVDECLRIIDTGMNVLSDKRASFAAREALKALLVDGVIRLGPNADHTGLEGVVRFKKLGEHVVEIECGKPRRKYAEKRVPTTNMSPATAGRNSCPCRIS